MSNIGCPADCDLPQAVVREDVDDNNKTAGGLSRKGVSADTPPAAPPARGSGPGRPSVGLLPLHPTVTGTGGI